MEHANDHQHRPTGPSGSPWAPFGIPFAALLCYGLPVLLTAFGLTAAGAILTANRYFILGGMVVLMGVVMFIGSRRGKHCGHGSCCMPNTNQTRQTPQDER
ncbi:hypothetical protein [Alicyclobacillus macrosporangiidus]|uniref:hypothetical protein n=1 Tax=Alicyclobacillus macrosporangiidus TaxID=392015 RepID=UPI000551A35E|nr:hypothetical protein [Alicyclobacillus macrosporangiidus]